MAFRDLREWIAFMEDGGELKRVKVEVDWDEEIGAITRKLIDQRGPIPLFERIKGYEDGPCRQLVSYIGSHRRTLLSLGLPEETTVREGIQWVKEHLRKPLKPVVVETGPCKENVLAGEAIDLARLFPVPKWHPRDGGRYICTAASIVTRDPETGEINVGNYRGMIADRNKISVFLSKAQHWGKHFAKYEARGEAMPVAVVIGFDPLLFMCAASPQPCNEYELYSALRGEPIELVRCETSNLLVPARAEIVIEGYISPDPATFLPEGPFGEYTGYYGGGRAPRHVIQVERITFRNDPIFLGVLEGHSPGHGWAHDGWIPFFFGAATWYYLEEANVPGIRDIYVGFAPEVTLVQIHKVYEGHAQQVAAALWGSHIGNYLGKFVIVVDEDVNIHDPDAVYWALAYRVNPDLGDIVFFGGAHAGPLDPSIPRERREWTRIGHGVCTKVLIDATVKWGLEPEEFPGLRYPPLSTEVSPHMEERVQKRWKEYGF